MLSSICKFQLFNKSTRLLIVFKSINMTTFSKEAATRRINVVVFDVNGTIMAVDSILNLDIETIINQMIWEQTCYLETIGERKARILMPKDAKISLYSSVKTKPNYQEKYQEIMNKIEKLPKSFFTSFIKALDFLAALDKEIVIMFQSFGNELPSVIEFLKNLEYPFKINEKIHTSDDIKTELDFVNLAKQNLRSFVFVKNDFMDWNKNWNGKVVVSNAEINTIIFDDNARMCVVGYDHGEYIPVVDIMERMAKNVRPVLTHDALMDDRYFVKTLVNFFSV